MSGALSGARQGNPGWFGRLVSRAVAAELSVFVVPGPEVARAHGLDLEAAGLRVAYTPRHASALLVVGELPEDLRRAAAVAYAQMPRPRAVLAVGAEDVSPLPGPDVSASPDGDSLAVAVAGLRRLFAEGTFASEAADFEADALRSRTEYACPMHPEVVQEEPGTCPRCGMDLVAREAGDEAEDAVHGEGADGDGTEQRGEESQDQDGPGGYAEEESEQHGGHEDMDHGAPEPGEDFMSMVEMTEGTPRSSDGLQMEWVDTPFGPLLPGLPGGLTLSFTLDGDTVARTDAGSAVGRRAGDGVGGAVATFIGRFSGLDPLAPAAYRLLALRAVESALGAAVDEETALARVGALERERAASHLSWLASLAHLVGYPWLAKRAGGLQLVLQRTGAAGLADVQAGVERIVRRAERTPILRRRLDGVGILPDPAGTTGPVARAGGLRADSRADESEYRALGFRPVVVEGGDALARLRLRLAEARQSLELAQRAGTAATGDAPDASGSATGTASGTASGTATVETPRGAAELTVTLENGVVSSAELATPSDRHLRLVETVTLQREVADALVGVASLDISPWEVTG